MSKRVIAVLSCAVVAATLLSACRSVATSPEQEFPPFSWTVPNGIEIVRFMPKARVIALLGEPHEQHSAWDETGDPRLAARWAMSWTRESRVLTVFLNAENEVVQVADRPSRHE